MDVFTAKLLNNSVAFLVDNLRKIPNLPVSDEQAVSEAAALLYGVVARAATAGSLTTTSGSIADPTGRTNVAQTPLSKWSPSPDGSAGSVGRPPPIDIPKSSSPRRDLSPLSKWRSARDADSPRSQPNSARSTPDHEGQKAEEPKTPKLVADPDTHTNFHSYYKGVRVAHIFRGTGTVEQCSPEKISVRFDQDNSVHRYAKDKIVAGKLTLIGSCKMKDFRKDQRVFHYSHGKGTVQKIEDKKLHIIFDKEAHDESVIKVYDESSLKTGKIRILLTERYGSVEYTQTCFFADLQGAVDELQTNLKLQKILRKDWDYETGEYRPQPFDLSAVILPSKLEPLVQVVAAAAKLEAAAANAAAAVRESFTAPDSPQTKMRGKKWPGSNRASVKFGSMSAKLGGGSKVGVARAVSTEMAVNPQEKREEEARENLKLLLASGHSIIEPNEMQRPSHTSTDDFETDLKEHELLIELIAFHRHELWSIKKKQAGFRYGRSTKLRRASVDRFGSQEYTLPTLLPYHILEPTERNNLLIKARSVLSCILKRGYQIRSGGKVRASDLLSPVVVQKWQVSEEQAENKKKEDKTVTELMRRVLEAEKDQEILTIDSEAATQRTGSSLFGAPKRTGSLPVRLFNAVRPHRKHRTSSIDMTPNSNLSTAQLLWLAISTPANPLGPAKQSWDVAIMLGVLFSSLIVPLRLAFNIDIEVGGAFFIVESSLEVLFLLDVVLSFRTAYFSDGMLVVDSIAIAKHYVSTWFVPDALGSVPAEIIRSSGTAGESNLATLKMLRMLKLLRLIRLMKIDRLVDRLNGRVRPAVVTLTKLIFVFGLVLHLLACAYWAAADQIGFDDDENHSWVPDLTYADPVRPWQDKYVLAFHYSIRALVGADVAPTFMSEYLFQSSSLIIGIILTSCIIGSATTILSNIDKMKEEKQDHMNKMSAYMKAKNLPQKLQSRIYSYYTFLWNSNWAANRVDLFPNLPTVLSIQLELSLKKRLIKKCELFSNSQPNSVLHLVRRLQSGIAIPEEVLYREGESGERMFFLVHGTLAKYRYVNTDDDVPARLIEGYARGGDTLGDLAFFEKDNRYANSVRATSFCELETLSFQDLAELASLYGDIAVQIQNNAKSHARLKDAEKEGFSYSWSETIVQEGKKAAAQTAADALKNEAKKGNVSDSPLRNLMKRRMKTKVKAVSQFQRNKSFKKVLSEAMRTGSRPFSPPQELAVDSDSDVTPAHSPYGAGSLPASNGAGAQ